MYYRIHFDTSTAKWLIQLRRIWWRTVRFGNEKTQGSVAGFDTYEEAEKFVAERGIDKIYVQTDIRSEKNEQLLKFPIPVGYRLIPDN